MGGVPSKSKEDDSPVENVSWEDAAKFCQKLSAMPEERKAGRVYRLPTEAEWEYACRAGTKTKYSFGDDESRLGEYGWLGENSRRQTHPVGQKKPNAWGLYDMHGNVSEWCSDWHGDYADGVATDPRGPPSGSARVLRGGSRHNTARNCRSALRGRVNPSYRDYLLGLRLALSPSGAESPEATENTRQRPAGSEAEPAAVGAEAAAEPVELPSLTNSIGIEFKLIPAGTFMMGDVSGEPDEKQHEVTLTKPFHMGVYEVTNAEWKQVMGIVPSEWKEDDRPVETLSWADAVAFCQKLSAMPEERKAGRVYRLPTEAQWEYACRAG
jgi:formylglycine-generating enzyme required for sulfatase activity